MAFLNLKKNCEFRDTYLDKQLELCKTWRTYIADFNNEITVEKVRPFFKKWKETNEKLLMNYNKMKNNYNIFLRSIKGKNNPTIQKQIKPINDYYKSGDAKRIEANQRFRNTLELYTTRMSQAKKQK